MVMLKIGPFGDYIRGIAHPGIVFFLFTGFYRGFGPMFSGYNTCKIVFLFFLPFLMKLMLFLVL